MRVSGRLFGEAQREKGKRDMSRYDCEFTRRRYDNMADTLLVGCQARRQRTILLLDSDNVVRVIWCLNPQK